MRSLNIIFVQIRSSNVKKNLHIACRVRHQRSTFLLNRVLLSCSRSEQKILWNMSNMRAMRTSMVPVIFLLSGWLISVSLSRYLFLYLMTASQYHSKCKCLVPTQTDHTFHHIMGSRQLHKDDFCGIHINKKKIKKIAEVWWHIFSLVLSIRCLVFSCCE